MVGIVVAEPRLVLDDQKFPATVLTLRRRKLNCGAGPGVSSPLLAERALQFMEIEIETQARPVSNRVSNLVPNLVPNHAWNR